MDDYKVAPSQPYGLFPQNRSLKLLVSTNMKSGSLNLLQEYQVAYRNFYIPSQDRDIFLKEDKPVCMVKIKVKISLVAEYPTIVQLIRFESYHPEVTQYLACLHQSIMRGAIVQAHRAGLEENQINIKQIPKQVIELDQASTVELFHSFNLKYFFMNNRTLADPDKKLLSETNQFFFGMTGARSKVYDSCVTDTPIDIERKVKSLLQNDALTDVQIANICRRCNLHMSNPAVFICNALKNWLATQNIFLKKSGVVELVFEVDPEREIEISMLPGDSNYMEQTLHVKFLVINYHGESRRAEHLGSKLGGVVLEIFIYCHIPLVAELPIKLEKLLISSECPVLQPVLDQLKVTNLITFVNKFDDF